MANPPSPYEIEQQLTRQLAAITEAQERAIISAWLLAWSEISADLQDALADVLAAGTRVTVAAIVRSERLARSLAAVADRLEDLTTEAGITITGDLRAVVNQAVAGTHRLIDAQLPGDLTRRVPVPSVLEAIVRRSTEQITSSLLPVADETYAIIQRELVRGVAAGDNPRETAARMVERSENLWNFGHARAINIARTETLDAYRAAAEESEKPHADVLTGWVWLAHLGDRTCRSCLSMHGRLFPLEELGPHDHQQGRCSRCPVVSEEDGTYDLSWVPSADDHFASLPPEQQRAILGRKGYDAWLAGDFDRDQWTKNRETDGWRDAQTPASPDDPDRGSIRGGGRPPGGSDDDPPPIPADERVQAERGGESAQGDLLTLDDILRRFDLTPSDDDDPWEHLLPEELPIAEWLQARGIDPIISVREMRKRKAPDVLIGLDQVRVEFKALMPPSGKFSPLTFLNRVREAALQSRHVIIDARRTDVTAAGIVEWIEAAMAEVGIDLDQLVVLVGSYEETTSVSWWA